jgi:hypothetical protein
MKCLGSGTLIRQVCLLIGRQMHFVCLVHLAQSLPLRIYFFSLGLPWIVYSNCVFRGRVFHTDSAFRVLDTFDDDDDEQPFSLLVIYI